MAHDTTTKAPHTPRRNGHHPWRIIPSPALLKQLTSGPARPPYLFGTLIPRQSVGLWVAESSAGKTILMHAVGYALSTGTELLGMTPPRKFKVLHVDVESPGAVTREALQAFGTHPRWHFARVNGKKRLLKMLNTVARRYDAIIVDDVMIASPVKDENSNAEANRQIWPFVKIARQSKAAIVLLHNSGEGNPKDKFKSRGATARVDRPDMVVNLDDVGGGKRRLKVVKSRYPNLGQTLEFEIYAAPGTPYGYRLLKTLEQPATKQERLERRVTAACRKYRTRSLSRKQIAQVIRWDLTVERQSKLLKRTLKTLTERGAIQKPQRGQYQYPTGKTA